MTVAAAHSRTFYGLLARYQLGLESDLNFEASFPDRSGIDKLAAIPGGARALALAQIGQNTDQRIASIPTAASKSRLNPPDNDLCKIR